MLWQHPVRPTIFLYSPTDIDPGLFRATNALKHYRGFPEIQVEGYSTYLDKLVNHPAFRKTCSTEELYLESYERYKVLWLVGRDDY